MRISAIMTPVNELKLLAPNDSAKDAFDIMDAFGVLSLPVVEDDMFIGFLSKQFIYDTYFKRFEGDFDAFLQQPVRYFIHNRLEPIKVDLLVEEAASIFYNHQVRFLPIADENDKFIGIVTQKSLFDIVTKLYGLSDPKITIIQPQQKGMLAKITDIISKNGGSITNIAQLETDDIGIKEISIRLVGLNVEKIVKKLEEKGFNVVEFIPH